MGAELGVCLLGLPLFASLATALSGAAVCLVLQQCGCSSLRAPPAHLYFATS